MAVHLLLLGTGFVMGIYFHKKYKITKKVKPTERDTSSK